MSILEDPEEMRRSGYRVVDAIVERLSELRHDKAFQTAPRDVTEALLDGPPPEEGRVLACILVEGMLALTIALVAAVP